MRWILLSASLLYHDMLKNTIFYFLCLVCITTTIIACSSGGDGSSNNNPVNETVYKYESCSSDSEQPLIYFNKSEFDAANGNPSSGTTLIGVPMMNVMNLNHQFHKTQQRSNP